MQTPRRSRSPRPNTSADVASQFIQFLKDDVIGSWSKTFQLAVLIAVPLIVVLVPVAALVVVIGYLKLDPERWLAVGGLSGVVVAVASTMTWIRRKRTPPADNPGVTDTPASDPREQ